MIYLATKAFRVPLDSTGMIATDKLSLARFWETVDQPEPRKVSASPGLYIFSVRSTNGVLPWWVGKAEKQSLAEEVFEPTKLLHYAACTTTRTRPTAELTFLPRRSLTGTLSRVGKNGHPELDFIEQMLIRLAFQRNPQLRNSHHTRLLKELKLPGIFNSGRGRRSHDTNCFLDLMGVD